MSKAKMSRIDQDKKITSEKPISLAGVDFKKLVAAKPNGKRLKKKRDK